MLDEVDKADFLLIVCTETYYRRFRGHEEPGKGKGVDWEGALYTQEIYDARSRTLKFVTVFMSDPVDQWIPEPLRSIGYYTLNSEVGYQRLYDFLLEQAGVEPRPVGELKTRPRRTGNALTFGSELVKIVHNKAHYSALIKLRSSKLRNRKGFCDVVGINVIYTLAFLMRIVIISITV